MPPENDTQAAPAEKKNLKSILIIAAIMLLEGGGLTFYMANHEPETASADVPGGVVAPVEPERGEVLVLESQMANMRTGLLYFYDVRLCIEVDDEILADTKTKLEKRDARIRDRIRTLFAQSDPKYLEEPGLETIKRQMHEILDEILGEKTVKQVLIPKYRRYRGQ